MGKIEIPETNKGFPLTIMKKLVTLALVSALGPYQYAAAGLPGSSNEDAVKQQNSALYESSVNKGFGPQSPRDLSNKAGANPIHFSLAPSYREMNLCNIHFHKNAEHKGGEFLTPAAQAQAEGHGYEAGYKYSGHLSKKESTPLPESVCNSEHGSLNAGDTIELHYVHSSAQVEAGPTLGACLSEQDKNPQLRVEAQVLVLVNDEKAINFKQLVELGRINGYQQALHIPKHTGKPVQYAGSTTGPSYNEKASPLQVSWSVHPKVLKVSAQSVGEWCQSNPFKEDHAHGVRNLVTEPQLLSKMK